MSTEARAGGSDDGESPGDGFAELRTQLLNLPRRAAPDSFETELARRLASPPAVPLLRLLRMGPLIAAVTTLGGLVVVLLILLFPGKIESPRSAAVAPATEMSQDPLEGKILAKPDTVGADSLTSVKRVSTAVP
ncbi:MAG TPA: hypothetical protein VF889_05670 [Bacteroidota bacterium]